MLEKVLKNICLNENSGKHTQLMDSSLHSILFSGNNHILGIISRLDHIKSLYIDTIWLSPVYTSPMADFGYDVADYENIDPVFGTLGDFDQLVEEVHARRKFIYVNDHTTLHHINQGILFL